MKRKLHMTIGISASGKTTYANELVNADNNIVNINRDDIRFKQLMPEKTWADYRPKKGIEKRVTEIQIEMAKNAVSENKDIIISDTNLNKETRQFWFNFAEKHGYEIVIHEFPVSYKEAIKRDQLRENGVGTSVIWKQWCKWLDYKGVKRYTPDETKPSAIVVDIDGTIATMKNRSPYDWDKVHLDLPRNTVIDVVKAYAEKHSAQIIFLSGRDALAKASTSWWLENVAGFKNFELYTRQNEDKREDYIVKHELFMDNIANHYNVKMVFDDRPSVVRIWYYMGINTVFAVGDPFTEF